jgi:hypothetical protein
MSVIPRIIGQGHIKGWSAMGGAIKLYSSAGGCFASAGKGKGLDRRVFFSGNVTVEPLYQPLETATAPVYCKP